MWDGYVFIISTFFITALLQHFFILSLMSLEDQNFDNRTGNVIFGFIALIGLLYIWHYIKNIYKKDEDRNLEEIIAEKDRLIERKQEQLNRITKLLKRDTAAKKKLD